MSQLNNVQGTGNKIAEELRQSKMDRQQLDRRDKQIRFRCDHKDTHGRAVVTQAEDGCFVCKICGTKINTQLLNKVEVDRKLQEVINIVECIKLIGNPELTPGLAKVEEGVDSILGLYERVILRGGNNQNKNKNNNNNGNQRKANYKTSKL